MWFLISFFLLGVSTPGLAQNGTLPKNNLSELVIDGKYNPHPAVVFIELKGFLEHCVGTILNANWIITSPWCVSFGIEKSKVIIHSKSWEAFKGQTHTVAEIKMHPKYKQDDRPEYIVDNAIALLRVTPPFHLVDINLVQHSTIIEYRPHEKVEFCGFGPDPIPGTVNYNMSNTLNCRTNLKMDNISMCASCFNATKNNFCFIGKGCPSDSGGPLLQNGNIIGIYVSPCWSKLCSLDAYNIAIILWPYYKWIKEIVKGI